MTPPAKPRPSSVFALVLVAAFAMHGGATAQTAAPRTNASSLALRLADGSVVRVPCDSGASEGLRCAPSAPRDSASSSDERRRLPLTRRAQLFDAERPGVVASVRG